MIIKRKLFSVATAFAVMCMVLCGCSGNGGNKDSSDTSTAPDVTSVLSETASAETTAALTAGDVTEADVTDLDDSNNEVVEKVREIASRIGNEFSAVTNNRLFDSSSVHFSLSLDGVFVTIRVSKPEYIPDAAFDISGVLADTLLNEELTIGNLAFVAYDTDSDGRMIDETLVAWRSKDGVKGGFVSAIDDKRIDDCTVEQLYEYYGDKVKPFDKEETCDIIKRKIRRKASGLLHEDENSVLVAVADGTIAVSVRTYEEFLIPAAAEYAVEVTMAVTKRSELPFSRLHSRIYDNDEKGGIAVGSMVGWTTEDLETGKFISKPGGIEEDLVTLEYLYEDYSDYWELIEKAKNGERVNAT